MENEFIRFIAGLAPEGETMLFVRQVGKRWTPTTPEKYRPGGAWYGNTGSFIVDRLSGANRLSASAANVERVAVLVLDDVGTKAKPAPLPPTWRMETSPGNEQWGYVFGLDDQPKKDDFCAAITAIAQAGFTDEGATNAVRNFRLPGSVNLKPGRNEFASRLIEFHPDREFSLPQICNALGAVPGPSSATVATVLVDGGEDDDVLTWLSAQGLLLEGVNSAGWCGVVCPNEDEHSTDEREGRYFPASRAYKCLHAHCIDWGSNRFLEWVAEQGGPRASHGIRDDLMATRMASALSAIRPTRAYPDLAAQVVAEVERKEAGRLERGDWFQRFAYVSSDDAFFDLLERRDVSRRAFDAVYRHIECRSAHNPKMRIEASKWYDQHRQAMGAPVLQGLTYAAGQSVLCAREGAVYGNRWIDARPRPAGDMDASRWLEHAKRMIPDDAEREHVFDLMAFKLLHPDRKVNHGVLHGGVEGSGKDSLWHPFLWAIGGDTLRNVKLVRNEEILSPWGYAMESEVIVLNELQQSSGLDQRALANHLKPLLAAPPEYIPVNRKGLHPYDVLNRMFVVAFTNDRSAISLSSGDRRWFILWSHAPRMTDEEGKAFWDWLVAQGGRQAVAAWLARRDVRAFNPGATPMTTDAKDVLLQAGRSAAEAWLIEEIKDRRSEFSRGVVRSPWVSLCDRLQGSAPVGVRLVVPALLHALIEAGWVDYGMVHSRAHPTKKHLFVAPDMTHVSKADLRALADESATSALRIVK